MEEALKQINCDCIRICLFGPESSGKSTLSRKLAQHYNAPLVPEYARFYLQRLWDDEQLICRPEDLLPIAKGQITLENEAVMKGAKLVMCDTDLLSTMVYSKAYYDGWTPALLEKMALQNTYDLYLLTYIDTPWEEDDLRDRPERREEMYTLFKKALDTTNRNYIQVQGTIAERMQLAITEINKIL